MLLTDGGSADALVDPEKAGQERVATFYGKIARTKIRSADGRGGAVVCYSEG